MNEDLEVDTEKISQFIEEVDKDKDGKISKQELAKFIKRLLS